MDRHEIALKKLAEGIVIPATPLVLDENRKLDEKGMHLLMNYYMYCGVGGIATAVHTTQFEIREPKYNLYEPVLKCVAECIDNFEAKHNTVIARIAAACGDVKQAVNEAKLAKKYGYDAIMLSPGNTNHLTEDEMIERTKEVAKVMPVIGFYLQPLAGGRIFTYNYWERLCEIENVIAIKCAPFNRYRTLDVVRAVALSSRRDEITLYTGNDDNIITDLITKYRFTKDGKTYEKTFEGGLLGHWVVWTKKVVEMFEKIKESKKHDTISKELLVLANEVTDLNYVAFNVAEDMKNATMSLHEILHRQGLMKHIHMLDESLTLTEIQSQEIDRAIEMYPHLMDDDFIKENLADWKKELGIED